MVFNDKKFQYRFPRLAQFLSRQTNLNNVSEKRPEFFLLATMKAQCDGSGEGILLGDNTGGRAVMLRPVVIISVFGLYNIYIPTYVPG
jgi:hypothetical protein